MFGLSNYLPERIFLDAGFVQIYWYGFLLVIAAAGCWFLLLKFAKDQALKAHLTNLVFYLILFGLLGARIYHVLFYNFNYFFHHPWSVFLLWQGGLAIHGAIIAGFLTVYFYARKHRLSFWKLSDYLALVLPLGQAIGRWGNYFNQELFGKPCSEAWCIPIETVNRPPEFISQTHFHPVFLYESIMNLALFVILLALFNKKNRPAGQLTLWYLIGYSFIRFWTEFLRLDSRAFFPGLKPVQWLCLLVMAGAFVFYRKTAFRSAAD